MRARVRWDLIAGTTVGIKAAMAVTGGVLSGWVFLHMLGNLLVFAEPSVINGYGATLQHSPLVWVMRVGLSVAIAVHVWGAVVLTRRARSARPSRYRHPLAVQTATPASRSMRWGGLAVGLFLAYHLLHIFGPLHRDFIVGDVHHNLAAGLSDPIAGAIYVLATLAFGLHLHHGTWSLFRSLGHDGLFETGVRRATAVFAALVTVGFLAPCVAALGGLL
ncbi:MAG: succinate dehydrogenase cytochrome b subunit [Myxococcales bacterium]|nr:succinate dehydrogenase cytochrome b subunit [Myxococcales bacterium]